MSLHPEPSTATAGQEIQKEVLVPLSAPVERELSVGETHTYRAELDAGVWCLVVSQLGVDTESTIELPEGVLLGPLDTPAGRRGSEAFVWTLEHPGTISASIRPAREAPTGRYTVRIERLASAGVAERSDAEQDRVLAELAATAAARSFAAGSKEEARAHYRRALALWPSHDPAGKARTLVALAILTRSAEDPGESASLLRRALDRWRALGDRENEATTLNRLGLELDRLGESDTARVTFEQALEVRQGLEDPRGEVAIRMNLCLALQRQGEFLDARDCYEATLALVRELRDPSREAVLLGNLVGVYSKLGEPQRSLALYEEILARSTGARRGRTLSNRAVLYNELGEAEQALLDFGEALAIYRRLKNRRMEGTVLNHIGMTYLDLGDLGRAQTYLEQALPLRETTGDRRGTANTLRGLGQIFGRLGDWTRAFDAYAKALELYRDLGYRRGEGNLLRLLGQAHAEAGSLPRAVLELKKAIEIQQQLGNPRQEARALLELGRAYARSSDSDRALELLSRARAMLREVRDRGEEARALEAIARIERDRGRIVEALVATTDALESLEDLRVRAGDIRQRASFFAMRRGLYELHIDLLMRRHREEPESGHVREAFEVSERARSRALLDRVRADSRLDDVLRRRLRAATRHLAAQTERQMAILARDHEPEEAAAVDRRVAAALTELEGIRTEARRRSPGYDQLATDETVTLEQVQSLLDPGTLLLEYVLGEPRSYLWIIDSVSFTSSVLPGRETIESLARQAHSDLSTVDLRTGRTSRTSLSALSEWLLAPVASRLGEVRRIVWVADGALHYLPFGALPLPGSGEPMVERLEVVSLPSASTLASLRGRQTSTVPTKTLAVLADPVFDSFDSRLASVEGRSASEPESEDSLARVRGDLGPLGRLEATGNEAAAIVALVEQPSQRLLAQGFHAHRERVLNGELASFRYLHFATHGWINARHPELSGLVLAKFDARGRPRNGFLSMDDVYGLELSADLVVLSGCQTALGREIRGEGLLGLARGFMAAGVPRVVASLWPVQDEATARLMTLFYEGILAEGKSPAAALAAAQRSIREQRRWSDPYFWSAFVLLGDWR